MLRESARGRVALAACTYNLGTSTLGSSFAPYSGRNSRRHPLERRRVGLRDSNPYLCPAGQCSRAGMLAVPECLESGPLLCFAHTVELSAVGGASLAVCGQPPSRSVGSSCCASRTTQSGVTRPSFRSHVTRRRAARIAIRSRCEGRMSTALKPRSAGAFVRHLVALAELAYAGLAVELPDWANMPATLLVIHRCLLP